MNTSSRQCIRYWVAFCVGLYSCDLCAAPEKDSLYEMSLEALLSVKVVTGRPQTVLNAPSVVSTLKVDELSDMGVDRLTDMLVFLPGIEVNAAGIGNSPLQIRGISDSFNQKVLFLLNGAPYWMPAHGDIPLNGIPLNSIEKIEVIRGPGSVRYGTNASAGVINIITRPSQSVRQ